MQTPIEFTHAVGHALSHLYDPDVLRQHPLSEFLQLGGQANAQSVLRDRLIHEVEALKPASSVPIESRMWRVYKVLQLRYVQQMDQGQTAHQIGVGVRHLRREQQAAVQTLADAIFQKLTAAARLTMTNGKSIDNVIEGELSWLKEPDQEVATDVAQLVEQAFHLVKPLADSRGIGLALQPMPDLPPTLFVPAALRQAMISLVTYAISQLSAGEVMLTASLQTDQAAILFAVAAAGALNEETEKSRAGLHAIRLLLGDQANNLQVQRGGASIKIQFSVPTQGFANVLMVDDNVDVAELFKRYTFGSSFRIHHLVKPDDIFNSIGDIQPDIIILDIMIPGVDGWELLGRLRQHPKTSKTPVIICSVLPEEELALALGAAEYLAKPVRRDQLLGALEKARGATLPTSR